MSWTATGTFLNASKPLTWSTKMWSPYLNDSDASSPSLSWAASWYYLLRLQLDRPAPVDRRLGVRAPAGNLPRDTLAEISFTQYEPESASTLNTSALLPPLADRTQLGELVAERQTKQLKGSRLSQRLASNPWDLRGLLFIAREAWSAYSPQNYLPSVRQNR